MKIVLYVLIGVAILALLLWLVLGNKVPSVGAPSGVIIATSTSTTTGTGLPDTGTPTWTDTKGK